jgi:hypothetical protein
VSLGSVLLRNTEKGRGGGVRPGESMTNYKGRGVIHPEFLHIIRMFVCMCNYIFIFAIISHFPSARSSS